MAKLRRIMMFVLTFVIVMGTGVGTINAKETTTKNFKGNLNATYKNSGQNSKITIKKINSKQVSIKIVLDNNREQGTWKGKAISKDTIQFILDGGEKIKLKWKDKNHFTAKKTKNGFSNESVQLVRRLCMSLNEVKYTKVKKSSTVYYGASHTKGKDEFGLGAVSKITFKGNKMIVKGSFVKATSKKNLNPNKGSYVKKTTKTFKLDKNFNFYGTGGVDENGNSVVSKFTLKEGKRACKNANGIYLEFKVKNGKLVSLTFCS